MIRSVTVNSNYCMDHDGGGAGPLQCLGGVLSIMVTMPWPRSQSWLAQASSRVLILTKQARSEVVVQRSAFLR